MPLRSSCGPGTRFRVLGAKSHLTGVLAEGERDHKCKRCWHRNETSPSRSPWEGWEHTQAVSALRGAFEGHTGPLLAQARPSWPLVPKHSEAGELWQPPVGHCLLHWDLLGPPCSPHAGHPVCVPGHISGMNLPMSTFWRESDSLMGANCW